MALNAICVYALNSNSDFMAVLIATTETYATTLQRKYVILK